MRLHIDTDLGDNPDDACAVAMSVGWPGCELVGVTTVDDPDGRRADEVRQLLAMLGAGEVPVVAENAPRQAALDLLGHSVAAGATVAAIGPCANLAALEAHRPGALSAARVVMMGGWVRPFPEGYPDWSPARDRNVQADPDAALALFGSEADLTFVPCSAAGRATLRASDLPVLAQSGPVGAALARETQEYGAARGNRVLAEEHPGLPDDLVCFHWDPVTCAVALGWEGAAVEELSLVPVRVDRDLAFRADPAGRRTRVVTDVDGAAFAHVWLEAVRRAQGG